MMMKLIRSNLSSTGAVLLAVMLMAFANSAAAKNQDSLPDDPDNEVSMFPGPDTIFHGLEIAAQGFEEPQYTESELAHVLEQYAYVDPEGAVPRSLLNRALAYFNANGSRFSNTAYIGVVDFSIVSSQPRFFLINMKSGKASALHVAHGKNSDPRNSGYATNFSNAPSSDESSLGAYMTAEIYSGKHGTSLRMDGLSSTNSNVRAREIVVHGASYVRESNIKPGRSWGCFAVAMNERDRVIAALKGGALIYAGLEK